jgi:hypothetical protein
MQVTPKEFFLNQLEKTITENLDQANNPHPRHKEIVRIGLEIDEAKASVVELNATIVQLKAEVSSSSVEGHSEGFSADELRRAALLEHERKLGLAALNGAVATANAELQIRKAKLADLETRVASHKHNIRIDQNAKTTELLAGIVFQRSWELALLIERLKTTGCGPYLGDPQLPYSHEGTNTGAWPTSGVVRLDCPSVPLLERMRSYPIA